jgi:hypothetical protein
VKARQTAPADIYELEQICREVVTSGTFPWSSISLCPDAARRFFVWKRLSADLRFDPREGSQHIVEQVLRARDCALQLLF